MKKTIAIIIAIVTVFSLLALPVSAAAPTTEDSGGYAVAYGVVYAPTNEGYSVAFASGDGWYFEEPCPHADGQPVVVVYDTLYSENTEDWTIVIVVPVDPAPIR